MEFLLQIFIFDLKLNQKKYNLRNEIERKEIVTDIISLIRRSGDVPNVLNISATVESIDLIELSTSTNADLQFYWKRRESEEELLCIDSVEEWSAANNKFDDEIFSCNTDSNDSRIYGGIKFNTSSTLSEKWKKYGNYYFFLPKFEIRNIGNETYLNYNLRIESIAGIEGKIRKDFSIFAFQEQQNNDPGKIINISDDPDRSTWIDNVKKVKSQIEKGVVQKVVLSRESKIEVHEIDTSSLLKALKDQNPNAFIFMFKIDDSCILGASPELFYSRTGKEVKIDSLAGTRPRSNDSNQDKLFEDELLNSEKDVEEQKIVTESIVNEINELCNSIQYNEKRNVKKFAKVQHLYTEISAELSDLTRDVDLINALHPTPAMGGLPRDEAIKLIEEIEKHDRGFYSAPIGFISKEMTELAVCIRSGLLHKDNLYLYSGAGIVKDSDPESEWDEINNKLHNFLRVFEQND